MITKVNETSCNIKSMNKKVIIIRLEMKLDTIWPIEFFYSNSNFFHVFSI